MKSLPLFFDINRWQSISDFIREVNVRYLNMLVHGKTSYLDLVLSTYKEAFRNGFNFSTCWFEFSSMDYRNVLGEGKFHSDVHPSLYQNSQFYCAAFESSESITIDLIYQDRKFKPDQMEQTRKAFEEICGKVSEDPNQTIAEAIK